MKLKHYISKFLTLFSVVALLATNLFADNLCNEEITISTRNGTSNIGGSIDLTSNFGSTTTLGFGYSHSNSDRSLNLYSSYNAPSLLEQVRQGVHGISHITMDPALALHKFSSAAILQMTAPRDRMDMSIVRDLWNISKLSQLGESSTTSGIIIFKDALIRDFKKAHFDESEEKIQEKKDGTKALTGGPKGEDPDDEENKKGEKKPTSINQMQQLVKKNNEVPKDIVRFDKAEANIPGSKDHVHFKDGTSMNIDGSVHDKAKGIPNITNEVAKFLKQNGWAYELAKGI